MGFQYLQGYEDFEELREKDLLEEWVAQHITEIPPFCDGEVELVRKRAISEDDMSSMFAEPDYVEVTVECTNCGRQCTERMDPQDSEEEYVEGICANDRPWPAHELHQSEVMRKNQSRWRIRQFGNVWAMAKEFFDRIETLHQIKGSGEFVFKAYRDDQLAVGVQKGERMAILAALFQSVQEGEE